MVTVYIPAEEEKKKQKKDAILQSFQSALSKTKYRPKLAEMPKHDNEFKLICGDCQSELRQIPAGSVQTVVTSPPYWGLRSYDVDGQVGLEDHPKEFVSKLVDIFREVYRVLRDDGTVWLNIGDSYSGTRIETGSGNDRGRTSNLNKTDTIDAQKRAGKVEGLKPKNLIGIPWMLAFALREDGWYVRSDIIWYKPNAMPESVSDRPVRSHEHIFLLTKSNRYKYNLDNVRRHYAENSKKNHPKGKNIHDVWPINTVNGKQNFNGIHFAGYPSALVDPCVLAGSDEGDVVLDPFSGLATTGISALKYKRKYIGIELNSEYIEASRKRLITRFMMEGV